MINWSKPDYSEVYAERIARLARLRESPGAIEGLKAKYRSSPVDFVKDWGSTFDPRRIARGENPVVPFVLFPRQIEFLEWVHERWLSHERGLAEKSRDVGFTWLAASYAASMWLFNPMVTIGFGSRKEVLVDNGEDPDSILWKVRKAIELLPPEFQPAGFSFKSNSRHMLIMNPSNGSIIKGESGDDIGRGGRSSIYFVDEAAFLARPLLAEASLSATTDTRIDISTANGIGNSFYENRHRLPSQQIFVFDWTEDPRKRLRPEIPETEEVWYQKKKVELDSVIFASEVLRDYGASISNTYIATSLIIKAEQTLKSSIVQPLDVPWVISIDAAHFGSDESVIHRRQGRLNLPQVAKRKMNGVVLAGVVEELARKCLLTAPVGLICMELDGPGVSLYDQLMQGPFKSVVVGIHTGKKLKDSRNYNLRAWLWRQALEYLEEGEAHLEKDPIFRTQMTSLLFTYKGGKLLMESKVEYKSRFARGATRADRFAGPSPDRADAFILGFMPPKSRPIAVEKSVLDPILDQEFGY